MEHVWVAALFFAVNPGSCFHPAMAPTNLAVAVNIKPDVSKAKPLGHYANEKDLKKLDSCVARAKWQVILIMGPPSAMRRSPDGTEIWLYPWVAVAAVYFKDGICTATYYTAGY